MIKWIAVFGCSLFLTGGIQGQDECLVYTLEGHHGPVHSVAFSHNGDILASGGEDQMILLWDLDSGEILRKIAGHRNTVRHLTFSRGDRYLLSGGDITAMLWKTDGTPVMKYTGHVTHVFNAKFNPGESMIVTTSLSDKFRIWDRSTGENLHTPAGHTKSVLAACFHPGGKMLATGSLDRNIIIWNTATYEPEKTISAHGENIYALDFSSGGNLLASASRDKTIKIWQSGSWKIVHLLEGHSHAVMSVKFSPGGKYLVSGSYDKTVRLWEISTGNCLYSFIDHTGAIHSVDYSKDGNYVAAASQDGTVMVWEITPRIFAEYYYFDEIREEMEASGLFTERKKGEKRSGYRERQEKAVRFRQELFEKYHRKYLHEMPLHRE